MRYVMLYLFLLPVQQLPKDSGLSLALPRYAAGIVCGDQSYLLGIAEDQSFRASILEEQIENLLRSSELKEGQKAIA